MKETEEMIIKANSHQKAQKPYKKGSLAHRGNKPTTILVPGINMSE